MKDKFFVITNVIVSSLDTQNPEKQKKAQELMGLALSTSLGVITYQVVQEFINVAVRKFEKPLTHADCRPIGYEKKAKKGSAAEKIPIKVVLINISVCIIFNLKFNLT